MSSILKIKQHLVQSSKKCVLPFKLKFFEFRIQHKRNKLNWTPIKEVMTKTISKG